MKKFRFGEDVYEHCFYVNAENFEFALRIFKLKNIYFEEYCKEVPYKLSQQGERNWLGRNDLLRIDEYEYDEEKRKSAVINCYEEIGAKEWRLVATIPLTDFDDIDYQLLIDECKGKTVALKGENELVPVSKTLFKKSSEFKRKVADCTQKIRAMEKMKREMEEQVDLFRKELKSKENIIRGYERFMGSGEEIVQLLQGQGSDDTPLHIYQQKLYMDEEVGLLEFCDDPDNVIDFDYKNLDFFDEWIKKRFKWYMPHKKSLSVWQIRRYNKEYSREEGLAGAIYNSIENMKNRQCYILIRNGDNLYRLWEDLYVPESVFPTVYEATKMSEHNGWGKYTPEEKKEQMLPWAYIATFLQGFIERTDILGTEIRNHVNFMSPAPKDEKYVVFERNLEGGNMISDKTSILFADYLERNQNNIKVGDYVFLCNLWAGKSFIEDHDIWYRKWMETPTARNLYKVVEVDDKSRVKILYFESETVWKKLPSHYYPEEVKRVRRTGLLLDRREVFNISTCTEEELVMYLKDRRNRRLYLEHLPIIQCAISRIRELKKGDFSKIEKKDVGGYRGKYFRSVKWEKTERDEL